MTQRSAPSLHRFSVAVSFLMCCAFSAGCLRQPLAAGHAMPALRAAGWTNGEAPDLKDLAGKVIVLEVFATW